MAKIRTIYSSVWEKQAKTSIFGQKWPILTVFGQKRANFEFSSKNRNRHFLSFLNIQLHARRKKKSQRGLGEKWVTHGRTHAHTHGRTGVNSQVLPTNVGDQKSGKFIVAFERNGPKRAFSTAKFWPKTAKKPKTRIFAKNPKRHKSKFMGHKLHARNQKLQRGFSCRTGTHARAVN